MLLLMTVEYNFFQNRVMRVVKWHECHDKLDFLGNDEWPLPLPLPSVKSLAPTNYHFWHE